MNFNEGAPKVYSEEDLNNAATEYLEAEKVFNAIDLEAENFDEIDFQAKKLRWENARDNYTTINKALHPEQYGGENENATILPSAEQ